MPRATTSRAAPDHRYQHGLPGEESLQRRRGLRAALRRAAVAAILDAVVRAVDVPVTLKMRTGPDPKQRNALRIAMLADQRASRARDSRAHARVRVHRAGRVRDDQRGQAGGLDSRRRERRHLDASEGARRARAHGRRRADDRPRCAGPAVDLREIQHFLVRGVELAPPTVDEARAASLGISTSITCSTVRKRARASRASTSAGTRRIRRAASVPPGNQCGGIDRGADRGGAPFFDGLAAAGRAPRLCAGSLRTSSMRRTFGRAR